MTFDPPASSSHDGYVEPSVWSQPVAPRSTPITLDEGDRQSVWSQHRVLPSARGNVAPFPPPHVQQSIEFAHGQSHGPIPLPPAASSAPPRASARPSLWYVLALALGLLCGFVATSFVRSSGSDTSANAQAAKSDSAPESSQDSSTAGGEIQPFGDLVTGAGFDGAYADFNPDALDQINVTRRAMTSSMVDRWLVQGSTQAVHWAVLTEPAPADSAPTLVSWEGPVDPPPAWQLQKSETPGSIRWLVNPNKLVVNMRETLDGSWVKVTLKQAAEQEMQPWIDGLSQLASARLAVAPPGFWELPQDRSEVLVRYGFGDWAINTTLVDVTTISFESGLDADESQNVLSMFGQLGGEVPNFRGGTLFEYQPPSDANITNWQFGWPVGPNFVAIVSIDGSAVSHEEARQIARGLLIRSNTSLGSSRPDSSQGGPEPITYAFEAAVLADPPPPWLPSLFNSVRGIQLDVEPTFVNADTESIRAGDLGDRRFVYFESAPTSSEGSGHCATFSVGPDQPGNGCVLVESTGEPLCVYREDDVAGVGYRVTVLTDRDNLPEITIAHPDLSLANLHVAIGETGTHQWAVLSVLLPGQPDDVTGNGFTCHDLS